MRGALFALLTMVSVPAFAQGVTGASELAAWQNCIEIAHVQKPIEQGVRQPLEQLIADALVACQREEDDYRASLGELPDAEINIAAATEFKAMIERIGEKYPDK